jgi:hypothetical protein
VKYPPEVYQLASKDNLYQYQQTTSWTAVQQASWPIQELLEQQAAQQITHKFIQHVRGNQAITQLETPQGLETTFAAVCLSWPVYLEALYRAFVEGQSSGMRRSMSIDPWVKQNEGMV